MQKATSLITFYLFLFFMSFTGLQADVKYLVNVDGNGVAIQGYDPVSFFTEQEPQSGDVNIASHYQGAIYHFASQENKQLFDSNPQKYVPQYGGFCAVSVSMGLLEPVEIDTWSIVNNRLYFQRNAKALKMWQKKGPDFFISRANPRWMELVNQYGSGLTREQVSKNMNLTVDAAKIILKNALAYAEQYQAPGAAIAIVDAGGHLIYLERLEGTFPAAAAISIEKARSAALFRFSSEKLENAINGGRVALATNAYNALKGGVPIYYAGEVVGAIGVSGAASAEQDVEIANAGANAVFGPTLPNPPSEVIFIEAGELSKAFARGLPLIENNLYKIHASHRDPGLHLAEVHQNETDIFYVLKGSASIVLGGELIDEKMVSPGEIRGTSIHGGQTYDLKPGDLLVIPAGVPHWFKRVKEPIDYYTVKALS